MTLLLVVGRSGRTSTPAWVSSDPWISTALWNATGFAATAAGVGSATITGSAGHSFAATAAGVGAATVGGTVTVVERLIPDAILTMVGLSGSVSLIQDDPDSADTNWLVAA